MQQKRRIESRRTTSASFRCGGRGGPKNSTYLQRVCRANQGRRYRRAAGPRRGTTAKGLLQGGRAGPERAAAVHYRQTPVRGFLAVGEGSAGKSDLRSRAGKATNRRPSSASAIG